MMHRAVIGLGSNIEPVKHVPIALEQLRQHFTITGTSRVLETEPIGNPADPIFHNAAIAIKTTGDLTELTQRLKAIEASMGRTRTPQKHDPRIIDLDVLLWDGKTVDNSVEQYPFWQGLVNEACQE